MPRPKKADHEKAAGSIRVPVTSAEKAEIQRGADLLGMKVAAMLRDCGLKEARKAIKKAGE